DAAIRPRGTRSEETYNERATLGTAWGWGTFRPVGHNPRSQSQQFPEPNLEFPFNFLEILETLGAEVEYRYTNEQLE
ncbi:MAG: hypothetical protein VX632_03790, partial [Chloroflexota bacterium]|nr:hypothetical protein [Chloroflexota bacterium]